MSGSGKQLNAYNITSRYSEVVLNYGEPIYPHSKDAKFYSMCECPDKDIKFPK